MLPQAHIMSAFVLDRFGVAGINYHKADARTRGLFAVSKDDIAGISALAKEKNLRSVFVVSTCNRTEIYGFAEEVMILAALLTSHTKGNIEEFMEYAYLKSGEAALDHLYDVAAGLDSQILGDYEILGQLKQGVESAISHNMVGPIMHRTLSFAFQASKKIKTDTSISTGTVSVSYAAIDLLKDLDGIAGRSVLVVGTGKFGGNVCKNLRHYLPATGITVCNRTDETAMALAARAGVGFIPWNQLQPAVAAADIVIVCTNAPEPTILASHFTGEKEQLVLDLSIPVNVEPGVRFITGVKVIDVDEISVTILDKNLTRRRSQVPQAREIIQSYKTEFRTWLEEYRYSLHLKNWKDKLQELHGWQPADGCELQSNMVMPANKKAQKAVTRLAVNLRTNQEKGCQFINAINDYLQMP
ncbi:MAG: glutamyl-tRNA reductase [Chitinophagaceae bacterium]|nr:MAG: glutamyl-tRNA reductase [Chitinophagaceae bacterium]